MMKWIVIAVSAGILLAALLLSGAIPIKASSGHWRVTAFVLDLTKRRSVDTHSFFITAPPLDDATLVVKGAGHYESGCASCHGSPAAPRPRLVMGMTPHPPFLPERVGRWLPRELFYLVKHGIKFTGMPAWASHSRDDEIWAMVAFLRRLPSLDADGYRALAFGDAPGPMDSLLGDARGETRPLTVARCDRCHGRDGQGRTIAAFPRLAGQRSEYLLRALRAYAGGKRLSGVMVPVAASLADRDMQQMAGYYASRPAAAAAEPVDAAARARGAAIARDGVDGQDLPACHSCHDAGSAPLNPAFPRLSGQFAGYLELQLQLFAEHRRGGSPFAALMRPIAERLTPDQRRDVAAYFSSRRD